MRQMSIGRSTCSSVSTKRRRVSTAAADSIAAKQQALVTVRRQLAAARVRRGQAEIEYASTPDGACETYRRLELATGADRAQLRKLYRAGLAMAAKEYERRLELGHAKEGDGPLDALAVGSADDPLAHCLMVHQVMGWARSGADAVTSGTAQVGLIRLLPDGITRKRMWLTCPVDMDVRIVTASLSTVVRMAWADPKRKGALDRFLGAVAAAAVGSAIGGVQ